ncbi:MAG: anti-sigma F factor antagonist [Thermoactinomyces sp.]
MGLSLQIEQNQNVLVVRLSGELDHHTAEKVRTSIEQELDRGECTHLVLNLAELEFMDSSGLGVILGRYKKVSQLGGKMILCSIRPSVFRLMEMSGLFKILPTYDNEERAITACGVAS